MFIVGLTGGIACGKTTVSKMLRELNVPIIDADQLARKIVEPGRKAWRQIRETFGDSVLEEDGQLNRKKLGGIIFGNSEKRAQLNSITHPKIALEIVLLILHYFVRGHQFVIIDSPLLYEVNTWVRLAHKVIVVSCDGDLQLERLITRDNLNEADAKARISSQMPIEEKRRRAHYVVYNDNSLDETRQQVLSIHSQLKSLKTHWFVRAGVLVVCGVLTSGICWVIRSVLSIF